MNRKLQSSRDKSSHETISSIILKGFNFPLAPPPAARCRNIIEKEKRTRMVISRFKTRSTATLIVARFYFTKFKQFFLSFSRMCANTFVPSVYVQNTREFRRLQTNFFTSSNAFHTAGPTRNAASQFEAG